MIEITKKFYLIVFAFSLLFAIIFYSETLGYYFFQDDFFEINISQAGNLSEYLNFFKFRDDIIAYRPISLQNYFFISSKFFHLNPIGYHLIGFILFLASGFLVAKVVAKITNARTGLLTASFWLTSSVHFMSLSWIAAAYNLIGTFFWLLTSILFLKFLRTNRPITYHLSLITYLITVGSFEFSISWPAIFGLYYFYVLRNPLIKSLKLFFPFILISIVYLFLRLLLIKVPQIVEYQTTFNIESAKALFWYFLWALNIPEEFKKQIINNLLVFNPKFSMEYWPLITKTFWGAISVLILGLLLPLLLIKQQKINIGWRLATFSFVWFIVGIFPVLLLPNHTFSMYLTLASIGLYMSVAYFAVQSQKILLITTILVIWIYTSAQTLSFYKINSWMIEAQDFSRNFSTGIKRQYPFLPSGSIIYYPLIDHRHRQALLEHHALKTIYNDQTLSIFYNKDTLVDHLKEGVNQPVYIYLPE